MGAAVRGRRGYLSGPAPGGVPDPQRTGKVLAAIEGFWAERGYPPTVREVQARCGISSSSVVSFHLEKLERRGEIVRKPSISRGIFLPPREVPRPPAMTAAWANALVREGVALARMVVASAEPGGQRPTVDWDALVALDKWAQEAANGG